MESENQQQNQYEQQPAERISPDQFNEIHEQRQTVGNRIGKFASKLVAKFRVSQPLPTVIDSPNNELEIYNPDIFAIMPNPAPVEYGGELEDRAVYYNQVNRLINELIRIRIADSTDRNLAEELQLEEDCIYFGAKYAESYGESVGGQLKTVVAIDALLDQDIPMNVFDLLSAKKGNDDIPHPVLLVNYLTPEKRAQIKSGDYNAKFYDVVTRRNSQANQQIDNNPDDILLQQAKPQVPTAPLFGEYAVYNAEQSEFDLTAKQVSTISPLDAAALIANDPVLDEQFDSFMKSRSSL